MEPWIIALLAPENVAPLRLQKSESRRGSIALALLVQGRFREYERFLSPKGARRISDEAESPLVRAAHRSFIDSTMADAIAELSAISRDECNDQEIRTVAAVLASIALYDSDNPESALDVVATLLTASEGWLPLVRAVLALHASLRSAELKDYDRATLLCEAARDALELEPQYPNWEVPEGGGHLDPPLVIDRVTQGLRDSIVDNLQLIKISSADEPIFGNRKYKPTAEYWLQRDALTGSAARHYLKERFEHDVRDTATRASSRVLLREDETSQNLYAYSVQCQIAGNWPRARQAAELLGRERMVRPAAHGDPDWSYAQGLTLLRRSGNSDAYGQAVRRLREEGPIVVLKREVSDALERLRLDISKSDLLAIRWGAPTLLPPEADTACRILLDRSFDDIQRTVGGWFSVSDPLWRAVAALAYEVSDGDYVSRQVRTRLEAAADSKNHQALSVVNNLDWSRVSLDEQQRWLKFSTLYSDGALNDFSESILEELAYVGNRVALDHLELAFRRDFTLSNAATVVNLQARGVAQSFGGYVEKILDVSRSAMTAMRSEAAHGSYSFGGINPGVVAAAACTTWRHVDGWADVLELILDPKIADYQKDPVLDILAMNIQDVPPHVLSAATRQTERLRGKDVELFGDAEPGLTGPYLRFLAATKAVSPDGALEAVWDLVCSPRPAQRIEAVKTLPFLTGVIESNIVFGVLAKFTADDNVMVRAEAAEAISALAFSRDTQASLYAAQRLGKLLNADGVAVPFGVLRGIRRHMQPCASRSAEEIVKHLHVAEENHAIPRVRKISAEIIERIRGISHE